MDPLEPIPLEDVKALLSACETKTFTGVRDRAIFLFLLETGVRAQELYDIDRDDADMNGGIIIIRRGKGGKSQTVFLGRKTRRALRTFFRRREDESPSLFASIHGERLTYSSLRLLLDRRARAAHRENNKPTLYAFRRAFALNRLRNGVDVFALQKLMGHADLQIMRRYLAQNNQDAHMAHVRGSPVDNSL